MLGATQSWEEGKTAGLCVKQCWPKKKYLVLPRHRLQQTLVSQFPTVSLNNEVNQLHTARRKHKKAKIIKGQKPFWITKKAPLGATKCTKVNDQCIIFCLSLKNYTILIEPSLLNKNEEQMFHSVQRLSPRLKQMELYTTFQFNRNWIVSPDVLFSRSNFTRNERRFTRTMK